MSEISKIYLVDADYRRRATMVHNLANFDLHVEPFEGLADLVVCWPVNGVLLIHDDGSTLGAIVEYMTREGIWLPCICYSEQPGSRQVAKAVLEGAVDYVEFPVLPEALNAAVVDANRRSTLIRNGRLRQAIAQSRIDRLTRRQREVLDGVAGGMSNRDIGTNLSISPRTVEIHRAQLLTKLGAGHTSDAIRIACEAAMFQLAA